MLTTLCGAAKTGLELGTAFWGELLFEGGFRAPANDGGGCSGEAY